MSEIKHTPAPWKATTQIHWSGGSPYSESVYVTIGDETLTIGCHTGTPSQETLKANAKIIAAAPELLEACQAALNICNHKVFPTESDLKRLSAELQAAIAKATE